MDYLIIEGPVASMPLKEGDRYTVDPPPATGLRRILEQVGWLKPRRPLMYRVTERVRLTPE